MSNVCIDFLQENHRNILSFSQFGYSLGKDPIKASFDGGSFVLFLLGTGLFQSIFHRFEHQYLALVCTVCV